MTDLILMAEGVNGQVALYENRIDITRKGNSFFTHGFDGTKTIFMKSLTGIQFKETGKMTNGFIQFIFSGSAESKGGLVDATKDENTVMFNSQQQQSFEQIRQFIFDKI